MPLIHRFTRLFAADMHAVLDRLEEPDIVIEQSIREMTTAVEHGERHARNLDAQAQEVGRACEQTAATLQRLERELDVCLDAGNEDLARATIRRRLTAERQLETLQVRRATLRAQQEQYEAQLCDRQRELEDLRRQAVVLADRQTSGTARTSVGDDEVEVALLQALERRGSK